MSDNRPRAAKSAPKPRRRQKRAGETAAEFRSERSAPRHAVVEGDGSAINSSGHETELKTKIGRHVRALRQARGFNVKQLAERANVTPGMISQLERGSVSPSVATLVCIADVLGVPMGEFFDSAAPIGMVVTKNARTVYEWPLTGVRDEVLSSDSTRQLQVLWSRVAPRGTSGAELLKHGSGIEFVFVISGSMEILLEGECIRLEEGDAITFHGGVPHGFNNPSDSPAELVWASAPAMY